MRPADRYLPCDRGEAAALVVICAVILAASFLLTPTEAGDGIAELPFRACIFRAVTELPCPLCGMTTGFVLMSHGRYGDALRSNILGPPAYLLTWAALAWGAASLLLGRAAIPRPLRSATAVKALVLVIFLSWVVNLYLYLRVWQVGQ